MATFWKQVQTAPGQKVLRAWVIATVLGMWLSYTVTGLVVTLLLGWSRSSVAITTMYALSHGLIVSACQWVVLRHYFKKAYWWIVATGLGNFLSVVLLVPLFRSVLTAFADPSVWGIAPLFESAAAHQISWALATGVGVGIAQWLYLRRCLPKTSAWIAAVVSAVLLSQVVLLVPIPQFQSAESGITGFLAITSQRHPMLTFFNFAKLGISGTLQAGITGILLADFVARKQA